MGTFHVGAAQTIYEIRFDLAQQFFCITLDLSLLSHRATVAGVDVCGSPVYAIGRFLVHISGEPGGNSLRRGVQTPLVDLHQPKTKCYLLCVQYDSNTMIFVPRHSCGMLPACGRAWNGRRIQHNVFIFQQGQAKLKLRRTKARNRSNGQCVII